MSEKKEIKDIEEKRDEKKSGEEINDRHCCYMIDACGCYVDPCCCSPTYYSCCC